MDEAKRKPDTESEPHTFAELAERIAFEIRPYEHLYPSKGVEPTELALNLAKVHTPLLSQFHKIDGRTVNLFDSDCTRTRWEKYREKAIELGATANELPAKTENPFYDLIQLGKFCSARAVSEKVRKIVSLESFMEQYCQLHKGIDLKSRKQALYNANRSGTIKLPKPARPPAKGKLNVYFADELSAHWYDFSQQVDLPPLQSAEN